jgi:RND family efflux transporter MFP subunit
MKIRQAEESLSALEVRAPHEGIVVFQRDWRGEQAQVGDMAWRGQSLAEIPALGEMEAEVQVLEADAGGLAVGRPAIVILEGRPDSPFEATIRRVDNVPKPRTRGIPVQYFGVTLELSSTDPSIMKPGLRVHATLMLEERSDTVAVPLQAVFEEEGQRVAFRLTRGRFDSVPVVLGPVSHGRVVIEQGLEEGDVIALRDPTGGLLSSLVGGPSSPSVPTATPKGESSR